MKLWKLLPPKAPLYTLILMALFITGLAASIYLQYLDWMVCSGQAYDSFCNVTNSINCTTVAASRYAKFLGLPLSLYGMEYFLAGLLIMLLSAFRIWRFKEWEPVILVMTGMSILIFALLLYISLAKIKAVCLVCGIVHLVNISTFIAILFKNKFKVKQLLSRGFQDGTSFFQTSIKPTVSLGLVTLFLIAQFFIFPILSDAENHSNEAIFEKSFWKGFYVDGNALGKKTAPIIIQEFTDFQCPFCAKAHSQLMQLLPKYAGKVRLKHYDYPLDHNCNPTIKKAFHPYACQAAYYARCALRQNKYWQMEKEIFANNKRLENNDLLYYAQKAGLDLEKLKKCLQDKSIKDEVVQDIEIGRRHNLRGTPTYIINGKEKVVGYIPNQEWENLFNDILNK